MRCEGNAGNSFPTTGKFGLGVQNEAGQRLIEFCQENAMVIVNTGGSDGKASVYNVGDPGSIPGLGRSLEKGMATHSSVLGESDGQGNLAGYSA